MWLKLLVLAGLTLHLPVIDAMALAVASTAGAPDPPPVAAPADGNKSAGAEPADRAEKPAGPTFRFYFGQGVTDASPGSLFQGAPRSEPHAITPPPPSPSPARTAPETAIKVPWYHSRTYQVVCGVLVGGLIAGLVYVATQSDNVRVVGGFPKK